MKFNSASVWIITGGVILAVCLGGNALSESKAELGKVSTFSVDPIEPLCEKLIDFFTDASTNYTRCVIQFAKSYRRCQSCVDDFVQVLHSYHLLIKKLNNSILCTEAYPGMGAVEVFSDVYVFVKTNWEKGGCQNCFSWYSINSTSSSHLSNTTKKFQWLSLQFYRCMFNDSYSDYLIDAPEILQSRLANIGLNDTICIRCKDTYEKLNGFYVSNFETMYEKDVVICVDISESMNFSRYIWQQIYSCPMQYATVWPIALTSVILCCLPVAFYIASKIFGHDIEPHVVPSKRFRGSIAARVSTASDIGDHFRM